MGDKYIYDKEGRFIGKISSEPPGPGGCGCLLMIFLALGCVLILPGAFFIEVTHGLFGWFEGYTLADNNLEGTIMSIKLSVCFWLIIGLISGISWVLLRVRRINKR
jgi:hypothetical protein